MGNKSAIVDCKKCFKSFPGQYNLDQHMVVHNGKLDFQCNRCGRKFGWKSNLMQHRSRKARCKKNEFVKGNITTNKNTRKKRPSGVKSSTPSMDSLSSNPSESGKPEFTCPRCGGQFCQKKSFQRHLDKRVLCGEEMKRQELQQKKYDSVKPSPPATSNPRETGKPAFVCPPCGGQFSTKESLEHHLVKRILCAEEMKKQELQQKKSEGGKPNPPATLPALKCFKCGDAPGCRSNLVDRFKPQNMGMRYICPPCDINLEHSSNLTDYFTNVYHLLNKDAPQSKKGHVHKQQKVPQQECPKIIANTKTLKRPMSSFLSDGHKKICTGAHEQDVANIKQQKNPEQDGQKMNASMTALKRPMSSHLSDAHKIDTGAKVQAVVNCHGKKYSCPECGKKFMHNESLQHHLSNKKLCLKMKKLQQKKSESGKPNLKAIL